MRFSDYRCTKCDEVFEYTKLKDLEDFPQHLKCPVCGSKSIRIYSNMTFAVAEGMCGNAGTGYGKSVTYHTNSLVANPKGTKVKVCK